MLPKIQGRDARDERQANADQQAKPPSTLGSFLDRHLPKERVSGAARQIYFFDPKINFIDVDVA